MKQITLAIDFDGVIMDNLTHEPMEGVQRAIKWLESKGYNLIISTASSDMAGVKKWLILHDINLPVTDKKVAATAYIDDRAIRFTNWNDITSYF